MKTADEAPGIETDGVSIRHGGEDRYQTPHYESPLLPDPWKPYRRSRAAVKEGVLKLSRALAAVCGLHWFSYAALGIATAFISFFMDLSVTKVLRAHRWLYLQLEGNTVLQFVCWTLYPACLCAVASSFSHSICPFSTGSGIPEVRTMMAGMEMSHYLSLTHMFTKLVGLICTLAAGTTLSLGKVGPFVHLSTMLGAHLSHLCSLIQTNDQVKAQEKAKAEMLVVAAAVGVASCFGAPISGVLFSVEVTCSHFAVKNYLPCFFSAASGALTFRLFTVWSGEEETLRALFQTDFPAASPSSHPLEILLFASLGLVCGAWSCCFLWCHRWILQFTKTKGVFIRMLTTEKALYSAMVAFLLASVTFPHSAGQYMPSQSTTKQLLTSFLESEPSSAHSHNASVQLQSDWKSSGTSVYFPLLVFLLMKMWMIPLSCTLPVPAGYFMPVFVYGAALGRLYGEGVAYLFSTGRNSNMLASVNLGGFALAGAAAFSGAVTHTLSPALLAIELTGQFSHAQPILLATLVANVLARSGKRPSFYDALSISKRLPYLPSLKKAFPQILSETVGRFLEVKPVQLQKSAGAAEVQRALDSSGLQTHFPVVESHESQIFLGFVLRSELLMFLQGGRETEMLERRLDEICSVRPSPVLLSPHSTLQQAYHLLSLTGAHALFVTDRGRLVGTLTWTEMKKILEGFTKEA